VTSNSTAEVSTLPEGTVQESVLRPDNSTNKSGSIRKQIRGSSLLLTGRLLSVGINFATQILMVRYLTTSDFGALGYALTVVSLFQTFSMLQFQEVIYRYVPIYHEQRDYGRLLGTLVLTLGTVALTSGIVLTLFFAWPSLLTRYMSHEQLPLHLLAIMIFLVPLQALDAVLMALFAAFASSKAIFFRRHLLGPGLIFCAVLVLVLSHTSVTLLAIGYVVADLVGVVAYCWMLRGLLQSRGLWDQLSFRGMEIPYRELFGYSFPLLTASLVSMTMGSAGAFLLGYFRDTSEVAMFRAALPVAQLNNIVFMTFGMLYTPLAARFFAKNDYAAINTLYWRTAVWMAVLTFPIFALTFSTAQSLVVVMYGSRYAQSGIILALLSFGFYFNVALGFNGSTIKVLGKLRYTVVINVVAAIVNIAGSLLLIPRYGAVGAAIGAMGAMVLHNLLKQAGLRLASGLSIFDRQYLSFYLLITFSALGLFAIQQFVSKSIFVAVPLAALASLIVLVVTRRKLNIAETFPELLRVPGMRLILG
jgi:O-antigen/teichoic acid export membrane protein